jgi:hypothetical protein
MRSREITKIGPELLCVRAVFPCSGDRILNLRPLGHDRTRFSHLRMASVSYIYLPRLES